MSRRPEQLLLAPRTWGGRRPGAGRKPDAVQRNVAHRVRAAHCSRHPVHVTLRARGLPVSLRAQPVFLSVRGALSSSSKGAFRVLHFSVQADHLRLMVEADARRALVRGLQGLTIRVAKAVNRMLGRRGAMWSDRYHARALTTPRAVRHALVYVLQNWAKHLSKTRGIDGCSSAGWFDGWRVPVRAPAGPAPVAVARTWLARVGWQRHGLVDRDETPARARPRCPLPRGEPVVT